MNLQDEFILEALQLLEEAEECLMEVYNDQNVADRWCHFLRVLHSIKGSSGFMENKKLEQHCHHIENLCTTIDDIEKLNPKEALMSYLFKSIDHSMGLLKSKASHVDFDYYLSIKDLKEDNKTSSEKNEESLDLIIVDDDPLMLSLIDKYLRDTGLTYRLYDNPYVALEKVQNGNIPRIVVSDIQMPSLDGREFLKKFRSDIADVPFVFITALNESKIFLDLVNAGAYSVLQKPLEKNHFIYTIQQALKFATHKLIADKCLKHIMSNFSELSEYYDSINKPYLKEEVKKDIELIYELKKVAQ